MRKTLSLALAILFLALSACAQNTENLKLENVLEYEAKRSERIKAKEAAKTVLPETSVPPSPSPIIEEPKEEPSSKPVYHFEPSELSEFSAPKGFNLIEESEFKSPDAYSKFLFTPTAGWKADKSSALILTSMNKMDPEKLGLMQKKDFIADIEKTGREYGVYYQQNYSTPSTIEVKEENGILYLKVISKYLEANTWKTDIRYVYFYRPDYRLNFLITGKDEDIAYYWKEIQNSLTTFLKKIYADYVMPIPFRQSIEEAQA